MLFNREPGLRISDITITSSDNEKYPIVSAQPTLNSDNHDDLLPDIVLFVFPSGTVRT